MKKSVFISHSSKDKRIAYELCERLEAFGVGCWVAPRDIPPGSAYGESIIAALEACSVCLLLLSEEANASPMVANEIERAASFERVIVPLRIREVMPGKTLQLFVSSKQWVDAFAAPIKDRVEYIAAVVQAVEAKRPVPEPTPERVSLGAKAERFLEKALRHRVLSAVVGFGILSSLIGAVLLMQSRTHEVVSSAAGEMKHAAKETIAAVNPELKAEQSDEAMVGALRQGDVTTVRRLLTLKSKASPQMALGLVGELADKPDDLRKMLSAFRVASAERAESSIKETAALLDKEMQFVSTLGDRTKTPDDASTIEGICSGMGGNGALAKALSRTVPNRLSCINAFRSQSIIAPLWQGMEALTAAANELGLPGFGDMDWLNTITRVYTDVSRPKDADPAKEFRTFTTFSKWEEMRSTMFRATPIPARQQEAPRFLQSANDAVRYVIPGTIVVVEDRFYHDQTPFNDDDLKVAVTGLETERHAIFQDTFGVGFKLAGHPAGRPVAADRVDFRRSFSACWGNKPLMGSQEISDLRVSERMSGRSEEQINSNITSRQQQTLAARRYCNVRAALLPQAPNMSVWLNIIAYHLLSQAPQPAPESISTKPIPTSESALPVVAAPSASTAGSMSSSSSPVPTTPIEQLVGQPPTSAPPQLVQALGPGAQRKLVANLNTRMSPSTNAPLLFELQPEAVVVVNQLIEDGDWAVVSVGFKAAGFVRTTALERNSGAPTLGAANPVGVAAGFVNPKGWPQLIPGPVATALNERRKRCGAANESLVAGHLTLADIDGDGEPDFILDDANSCPANESFLCGATGSCSGSIYLSTQNFARPQGLFHRGFSLQPGRGAARDLLVSLHGSECDRAGYETCVKRFRWNGRTFVEIGRR